MMTGLYRCPACEAGDMTIFYEVDAAPAHSVLLLDTQAEALAFPTGQIRLGACANCGFVSNVAFEKALNDYSARYEATQSFSPTFNSFARRLADDLISRYDLHGKDLIEIGCGQGEFLTLLCEQGDNRGVGFDPAYRPRELTGPAADRLTFIPDFYDERFSSYPADFVCCKMTLEHIHPVADFVRMVRRTVGDNPDTVIFFQIPNAAYVLGDLAFWDVYYEHCSYFSAGSVARLFQHAGFDVLGLRTDYDDQYLMIEARPAGAIPAAALPPEADDLAAVTALVERFQNTVPGRITHWRQTITGLHEAGKRVVIWGGGSKGVAFLTSVGVRDAIRYVVDINPRKRGTFMAGTGQEIVTPDFLEDYRPDVVIVMNPIYCDEIRADLAGRDLRPEMLTV